MATTAKTEEEKMSVKEGYIGNWKNYPKDEIKVRVARPGPLGVPKDLWKLWEAKKIRWEEYERRYLMHVMTDDRAYAQLKEIMRVLKQGKTIRLMCYERMGPCHRFTLKEALESFLERELK